MSNIRETNLGNNRYDYTHLPPEVETKNDRSAGLSATSSLSVSVAGIETERSLSSTATDTSITDRTVVWRGQGLYTHNRSPSKYMESGYNYWPKSIPQEDIKIGDTLNELTDSEISTLTADKLNSLALGSIMRLKSRVLNNLKAETLKGLQSHVLNNLNPGALQKLKAGVFLNLSDSTVHELGSHVMAEMSSEAISALHIDFIGKLSDETLRRLEWSFLNRLPIPIIKKLDLRTFNRSAGPFPSLNQPTNNENLDRLDMPRGLFRTRRVESVSPLVLENISLVNLQELPEVFVLSLTDEDTFGITEMRKQIIEELRATYTK